MVQDAGFGFIFAKHQGGRGWMAVELCRPREACTRSSGVVPGGVPWQPSASPRHQKSPVKEPSDTKRDLPEDAYFQLWVESLCALLASSHQHSRRYDDHCLMTLSITTAALSLLPRPGISLSS